MNRCVLDSVLWFHIECPRAAGKFDDPLEFKRKFRDFFSQSKSMMEANERKTPYADRINKEYGHMPGYPEDLKTK